LKGRNHPEATILAIKNTDFFEFNPKNLAVSIGKVN